MLAIARKLTPAAMLNETYTTTVTNNGQAQQQEINILQEAREKDLSYAWWHEKLENIEDESDPDPESVGGCSKPDSIRYMKNEFSLQCMRQVWRLYWIAKEEADNQARSSPVPNFDPQPTFDDLPFHLKDFLRYVAFRIYGGAPFTENGEVTKADFWKNLDTASTDYQAVERFFNEVQVDSDGNPVLDSGGDPVTVSYRSATGYPGSATGYPDWDAAPSWINSDMSSYTSWNRPDRYYDGVRQSLRLQSTCLNYNPILGTIWHWPQFEFAAATAGTSGFTKVTRMPFWHNNEEDYDYPIGSSLCAGTLPGFPLTMHDGIYFLDGMHIYGKMYKTSDRRLKRNLQPLQVPEGGGMTSPRRTLLERHYPDLLSDDGGVGVDADGMVAALWQEVRILVRQQQEELNTLKKEVSELLCRRLPDQCSVGQEPPG